MLPVTLALGLINFNFVVNTFFASRFVDPQLAPSAIDAAFRIYMLPQGMFSVAVATVLFPRLSRLAARGDSTGVQRAVSLGLRQIGFLLLPASAVAAVLAEPIVRLLYQRGRVHRRADARRRGSAGRLRARADLQRDDADAQPLVLQPAGALGSDCGRAREPRRSTRFWPRSSTASASGGSRWRRPSSTSPALWRSSRSSAAASVVSTAARSRRRTGASLLPRRRRRPRRSGSGTDWTRPSAARSARRSSRSASRSRRRPPPSLSPAPPCCASASSRRSSRSGADPVQRTNDQP